MPVKVRELASRYPGIGEPPLECANPNIRAAVRDTDDERICFVFNRGTGVETAEIHTKDERGCYLISPDTCLLYTSYCSLVELVPVAQSDRATAF